jgi:NodT family efflux transporter outer membrane factor (OMF) lipoprotein
MIGTLCLLPPLAGCIVGYEKPDLALEVPDKYRHASSRNPEAALPSLDWWRGFRSRELTTLIEAAQAQNLDIASAVARIRQADAQARIIGAALLPTVDANFTASRSRASQRTAGAGNVRTGSPEADLYNANLSASYEIDFWGKNRANLLAAEENAVAARYAREVVALTTMATVANTYFQILNAQERLRLARENVAAATRVLGVIRERSQVGTASRLDIVQQESLLANTRAAIPLLQITLDQSVAQLAVLIGRAPEVVRVRGGGTSGIRVPTVTPGLPSDILRQRPDIRQAEATLASANYSVESARAAFFPNITLTGSRGFQSAALAALFGPGAWYYTAAAALAQPVFDGFLRQGQLELAQGQQLEFLQDYRKSVLSAFSDVEQALIAVQQQAGRERLQAEAVRAAREAFELSERRLREGTVDLITVLTTQQTLFQAQDTLAQVRFARLQAVVSLFQALGGGWPPADTNPPVSQ